MAAGLDWMKQDGTQWLSLSSRHLDPKTRPQSWSENDFGEETGLRSGLNREVNLNKTLGKLHIDLVVNFCRVKVNT